MTHTFTFTEYSQTSCLLMNKKNIQLSVLERRTRDKGYNLHTTQNTGKLREEENLEEEEEEEEEYIYIYIYIYIYKKRKIGVQSDLN